jgi:hypothetical protein
MRKYLGADFPGLPSDGATGEQWKAWVKRKNEREAGQRQARNLHYTRHDNIRMGRQWISQRDSRTWREPKADKNILRPVLNMVGPALNFRLGMLMEQRPGFAYQPINSGTAGNEIAEAQQAVVEYEFYRQRAWNTFLDALFWTQTHGVAFVEVFVDKTRGPKFDNVEVVPETDERFDELLEFGYEQTEQGILVPLDESGNFSAPNSQPHQISGGELYSRVVLANELLVDAEARTINGPDTAARWVVKRKARDLANAKLELGDDAVEGDTSVIDGDPNYESLDDMGARWQRGLPPFPSSKTRRSREIVWEHSIFLAKDSNALPHGAWLRIVGNKVIEDGDELPGGVIPFARFADGSPDPQLFSRPEISDWIPDQQNINAILQSAMQAQRQGGGRLLASKNTVLEESYSKIIGSLLEYTGSKPEVIQAMRMSPDSMPLLMFWIRQLENKTLWNDTARGQVTGGAGAASMQDVSGRAVLGAKELFERGFGPMIRAAAEGTTEWGSIVVQLTKYLTADQPARLFPRVGRPDLAIAINAEKLGDDTVVYCDAETMMPVPRSLREQILLERLKEGLISQDEYKQRSPYADIRNLNMGDTPQWNRAKWINTLLEERYETLAQIDDPTQIYAPQGGITILWQDTPSVHKRALLEIILNERKPWALRKIANDRWGIYDQLERAQSDPSGMYMIPWEVIGVPPDKMIQQQRAPAMQGSIGNEAAVATGTPAPSGAAPAALPTSPTPDMSAVGPSAASQDAAQPLGSYGDIERAAMDTQS